MGLKLIILIVVIILLVGFVAGLYYSGALEDGGIAKLLVGGTNVSQNFMSDEEKELAIECTDPTCLFENFALGCKESYGKVPIEEEEMLVYLEVAGEEKGKCILNVRLLDANGPAAYGKGLEATCKIAPEEVATIQENFNLNEMNCEGPLYEAAKLV